MKWNCQNNGESLKVWEKMKMDIEYKDTQDFSCEELEDLF